MPTNPLSFSVLNKNYVYYTMASFISKTYASQTLIFQQFEPVCKNVKNDKQIMRTHLCKGNLPFQHSLNHSLLTMKEVCHLKKKKTTKNQLHCIITYGLYSVMFTSNKTKEKKPLTYKYTHIVIPLRSGYHREAYCYLDHQHQRRKGRMGSA